MSKPTPRPWKIRNANGRPGYVITGSENDGLDVVAGTYVSIELDETQKANAAHIIKCVNMHDDLVGALELALRLCPDEMAQSNIGAILSKAKGREP